MEKQAILDAIKNSKHNKVKYAIADIDGVLRGKVIHKEKFFEIVDKGVGFCDVIFGWDVNDACYDNTRYTGWHTGYPDANVKLDLNSFRTIPWEQDIPFLLGNLNETHGNAICPRSLVKRIDGQCRSMGYTPVFSLEFEWFNFREEAMELNNRQHNNPQPVTPGMFGYSLLRPSQNQAYFSDLFEQLEAFNIKLEGLHTETGPGVYEAAIRHDEIMPAADKAILFKAAVKEIAARHGIIASFMAKWNHELPGCGGHIHQSLWDNAQKNIFYDALAPDKISETLKSYIAGQLACLPHILPMYAPTINSYKRLIEGAWAPTTLTWGIDNRTAALRVINLDESSTRLETRVPGADVNPYLAMAAALASGLYGIQNNLKLTSDAVKGNGYKETSNGVLPSSLTDATKMMKTSAIARELFGDEFVEHFTATREWECRQFAKHVTNWELKRYFEII
jgi:glutamine synthetase